MNVGSELYAILDRRYGQEVKALLPEQTSADIAVYAALWLFVRCGGLVARSCLNRLVEGEACVEIGQYDLPALCIAGFRLNAGISPLLSAAELAGVQKALQQVMRRKPHTDELSGPADDLLSLLGLILLAEVAAPQLVEKLRSWADGASPSPSLRAALVLAGVEVFERGMQLDMHSPSSLAAYLQISVADDALEHRLFPATRGSDIASHFATAKLDSVRPGSFDALAVLVTLELLLDVHQNSIDRGQTVMLTPPTEAWSVSSTIPTSMMKMNPGFEVELARTIADREQATETLQAIGFPLERIPSFANFLTPLDFWRQVCRELRQGVIADGLSALRVKVAELYPGNEIFRKLPEAGNDVQVRGQPNESERTTPSQIAILLVFANPHGTDALRFGTEERALREAIRSSTHRARIKIEALHATTIDDLRRALLRDRYDIVQFSGHGSAVGLSFENAVGEVEIPDSNALVELLHRRGVRTVLLNACDSLDVSLAGTSKIDYTIAMSTKITDESAIEFSRGFYDALGEGLSIPEAFAEGVLSCKLKKLETSAVFREQGRQRGGSKSGRTADPST